MDKLFITIINMLMWVIEILVQFRPTHYGVNTHRPECERHNYTSVIIALLVQIVV